MKLKYILFIISGLLAVVLIVIVLKFYYQNDPLQSVEMPKCTFFVLTGWKCPGCGGQRALHHLLKGEIWQSFCQNPLLYFATAYIIAVLSFGKKYKFLTGIKACSAWLIGILAFWILRNVV
ncbi:MAG: DUF2752 domain-containing protein [Bacteroidales bacterium]|nr:DUF2752 domain-containing protein [Bacteroidales bacterium]